LRAFDALVRGQAEATPAPVVQQITDEMLAAGAHAWMTADIVDPARVFNAMNAASPAALKPAEAVQAGETSTTQELERLRALINSPHTEDFMSAVNLEAAHQQERWGAEHDEGKEPADWFWLLCYLSGKALAALIKGDKEKGLHHIISSGAMLLNWHRNVTGEMTGMRPGIATPPEQTGGGK